MRPLLAALCTACLLAGCGSEPGAAGPSKAARPAAAPRATIDQTVQFLLDASARDFQAHLPPYPASFRGVRVGHQAAPDGTTLDLLSGEFLPTGEEAEWVPFATIKTSGYEQLLGAQARSFAEGPSITWEDREDLSAALKSQLDALR